MPDDGSNGSVTAKNSIFKAETAMTPTNAIRIAMRDADQHVIAMDYVDSKGVASHRVVSPIRFLSGDRFLALCLCREEPRQFYLNRCHNVTLMNASDVMMPVAMG